MHQALYRKWRPATFDEVVGQEHITSVLRYEVEAGKTSHAYLFCGSRGTGKTTCAKILAKAVNCLHPVNGNPCGVCEACRAIEAGTATDVLEMDAASNNGVDCIRDIREEVVYAPAMLKSRVYIVDEVHMLSQSAFNALLKTLEEPPQNVVFILATTELHKIPATILSRCQRFDFRRIDTKIIADRLRYIAGEEKISVTEDAACLIGRLSQGGMRDAISLLELCAGAGGEITEQTVLDCAGAGGRETVFRVVRAVLNCDYETIFGVLHELYTSSKDITVFWQELMSYYRDMLVAKSCKNAAAYLELTGSEAEKLNEAAALFSYEVLLNHCRILDEALGDMQRVTQNSRLIAEFALLRLCDDRLDNAPDALLARLRALEAGTARPSAAAAEPVSGTPKPVPSGEKKPEPIPDPTPAAAPTATPVEANPEKKQTEKAAEKTVLRPLSDWIEIVRAVAVSDRGLSAVMQNTRAFLDSAGRVRIKTVDQFTLKMIGTDTNRAAVAAAAATVLGRPVTADDVVIEWEKKAPDDGSDALNELDNNLHGKE